MYFLHTYHTPWRECNVYPEIFLWAIPNYESKKKGRRDRERRGVSPCFDLVAQTQKQIIKKRWRRRFLVLWKRPYYHGHTIDGVTVLDSTPFNKFHSYVTDVKCVPSFPSRIILEFCPNVESMINYTKIEWSISLNLRKDITIMGEKAPWQFYVESVRNVCEESEIFPVFPQQNEPLWAPRCECE